MKRLVRSALVLSMLLTLAVNAHAQEASAPAPEASLAVRVPSWLAQQQHDVASQLSDYRWKFTSGYAAKACDVIDVPDPSTFIFTDESSCRQALTEDNLAIIREFYDPTATVTIKGGQIKLVVYEKLVYDVYSMFIREGDWKDIVTLGQEIQAICGEPIVDPAYTSQVSFAPSRKCQKALRANAMPLTNYGMSYYCMMPGSKCFLNQIGPWGDLPSAFLNPQPQP